MVTAELIWSAWPATLSSAGSNEPGEAWTEERDPTTILVGTAVNSLTPDRSFVLGVDHVARVKGEQSLGDIAHELHRLQRLSDGWDGYAAPRPNGLSVAVAAGILDEVRLAGLRPRRVVPSTEGGVALYFRHGMRRAEIDVDNDGDVFLVLYGGADPPRAEPVRTGPQSLTRVFERMRDFLR